MKSMMPTQIKQELICQASLFPLQKSCQIREVMTAAQAFIQYPEAPVTTLSDFPAQARNICQSRDKRPTSAHYVEILCALVAMTVLQPLSSVRAQVTTVNLAALQSCEL